MIEDITGEIYGYDTNDFSNLSEIETLITNYGYDTIEVHLDNDNLENDWAEFLTILSNMKDDSKNIILTFDDDFSNQSKSINNINTTFPDLLTENYTDTIHFIKINPIGITNTTGNTTLLNTLGQTIRDATQNNFTIYVKNYVSNELDTNYVKEDIYEYISTNDRSEYINIEIGLLRSQTSLTRLYNNLSNDFKGYAYDWRTNIILNLRDELNISTTYPDNVAELNNLDIIVANNGSSLTGYVVTSVDDTAGYDAYDLTRHYPAELDTDKTFVVNVLPYSANIIQFVNLAKLEVTDLGVIFLYANNGTTNVTIDTITSTITRSETEIEDNVNVSFNSGYDWNLPLYDKTILFNVEEFLNISVDGGTLNVLYNSNCSTQDATFSETNISGSLWYACYYNESLNNYSIKVIMPYTQDTYYLIEGYNQEEIVITGVSGVTSGLPDVGEDIGGFMSNIVPGIATTLMYLLFAMTTIGLFIVLVNVIIKFVPKK